MGNVVELGLRTLCEVGLLPIAAGGVPLTTPGNLLPTLQEIWNTAQLSTDKGRTRQRHARRRAWVMAQAAQGAALTVENDPPNRQTAWHGPRLVWWPRGVPTGMRIGLASSRLGRRLDTQEDWFTVFRAACSKVDRQREILLTAAATTTARFVARAAELFDVHALMIMPPRANESCGQWCERILKVSAEFSPSLYPAFVSPPLPVNAETHAEPRTDDTSPLRDRLVVAWSDRLLVFHVRARGHWERLVRARLADPSWPAASVFVALGDHLVPRHLAGPLLELGAVGWLVLDTFHVHQPAAAATTKPRRAQSLCAFTVEQPWRWLTHCTRAAEGAWPDQSTEEYVDELLLHRDSADRSAYAVLRRIVTEQRLLATRRTIRGQTRVVSFTAVPFSELPCLHIFRPHQGRWDFEPFGVCIDRQWLSARGARAVCYGDDAAWSQMSAADRPFFQLRETRGRRSQRRIDWTVEQEWRHLGDVDLRDLPPEAGLIFAASESQAAALAEISRWPVTVLPLGR